MKDKKILLANSLLLLALLIFVSIPHIANIVFRLNGSITENVSLLLSGGTSVIALGGIALLYCRITKRKFSKVMVIKKITTKQVLLTMFVAFGTFIFAAGINSISMKLFPIVIKDGMEISKLVSNSSTLLGIIVIILIPAFFEEVFFRGVFLDAYEGKSKKIKYFIIITIFATFHGNIMQIIYVLFLGFILLEIREYTGSLLGSMLFHATNNAISFTLSKVANHYMKIMNNGIEPEQAAATAEAMNVSLYVVMLRASIFLLIGGAILFINLRKLKEYKEEKDGLEIKEEVEYIQGEYVQEEKYIVEDKTKYIPLVIYFVSITILIILSY
ncbi:CPBP family intramembrane glutamic endopeptidase [Clostridium sp.]|uniref:CPBP family intramembrane glutamic endopeptidase n=1 Tax=Clostridium sp. TaxID=1506 RepID=UPI001A623E51|nr:CPBP family intramembrane glutamic endopeptidase [Clostridium sp.]MBK5234646.1 CPBP family intramembrane metalloprotease [Clostridium sp.]